jgi:hypothetical protein
MDIVSSVPKEELQVWCHRLGKGFEGLEQQGQCECAYILINNSKDPGIVRRAEETNGTKR